MGSLSLRLRYRPVRIGWCLEAQQRDQLHTALRYTHVFAGGWSNPLIPVDAPDLAESLIDRFRVDLLFPVADTPRIAAFVKAHDYLPWPEMEQRLFYERWQDRPPMACFLDVYHAARRLRQNKAPNRRLLLLGCDPDDPLASLILATAGAYPTPSAEVPPYEEWLEQLLGIDRVLLHQDEPIPLDLRTRVTPARLTTHGLERDRVGPDHGVYVGDAGSLEDLIAYWNLRAAGSMLVFFDPREAARLTPVLEEHKRWLATMRPRAWHRDGSITVYSRDGSEPGDLSAIGTPLMRQGVGPVSWNGLNIRPVSPHWKEYAVLGSVDSSEDPPSLTFALPKKPSYDIPELHHQRMVISILGSDPWGEARQATFFPPYVPELNEYYGRHLYYDYADVRAEPADIWRSVGLIVTNSQTDVTLRAVPALELTTALFKRFGILAQPSRAGLVTSRLIAQMGGLQGCRVFKIEGVRTLIHKFPPDKSFTRSHAIKTINNFDEETKRPRFEPYERLWITPRRGRARLTPQDVLRFLLQRDVFRVGLELKCIRCELPFWQSLDEVKTKAECVYCGTVFNTAEQLEDRDWKLRRSGLFGQDDHQQGGIPVAVTLQQLDTAQKLYRMLYTTSLELTPGTASIDPCETDFVVLTSDRGHQREGHPQVVIGECKAGGGRITNEDAEHLGRVADALPRRRLDVFVLFAKTGHFSDEEVAACALAQSPWEARVILLSKEELEPYRIFESHSKAARLRETGLDDLANSMLQLYPALEPKRWVELREEQRHRRVAALAFDRFMARGAEPGRDWEDWFAAEADILATDEPTWRRVEEDAWDDGSQDKTQAKEKP